MSNIAAGDIWLVRFHPSFGSELKKYRPALVIRSLASLDQRFVLVVPLTPALKKQNSFEVTIQHPALARKSLALCWYMRTIDVLRLQTKLGQMSADQLNEIIACCAKFILEPV